MTFECGSDSITRKQNIATYGQVGHGRNLTTNTNFANKNLF